MNSSDIIIRYKAEEYSKAENELKDYLPTYEKHLLFSLIGINRGLRIKLVTKTSDQKREISRTVFSNYTFEYERSFGLISIIDGYTDNYNEVLNQRAFLKNSNGESYSSLPNVKGFYEYLLGGIEPLNEILYENGDKDPNDIFESIYEYVTDEDNKNILMQTIEQVKNEQN